MYRGDAVLDVVVPARPQAQLERLHEERSTPQPEVPARWPDEKLGDLAAVGVVRGLGGHEGLHGRRDLFDLGASIVNQAGQEAGEEVARSVSQAGRAQRPPVPVRVGV